MIIFINIIIVKEVTSWFINELSWVAQAVEGDVAVAEWSKVN